ncbi:MAG: Holliday junction resolvase-like protein [Nanoarchaeota archaeon]|mgnify:CR=1 FL=1
MDFLTISAIILFLLIGIIIGHIIGTMRRNKYWKEQILEERKDAIAKSRATLGGLFSEQLAPYLPDFPYSPSEVRFIGKPIDFVVFKGADNKQIDEVVFVEVKSGKAKINNHEKNLKNAIEKGKVRWEEYRIPEDVTKGKSEE